MKKVLVVAVILIAALAVVISSQPTYFRIVRSKRMTATPDVVFQHVDTIREWNEWSPWAKLDPNATNTFSGPQSGVGAAMSWSGNNDVGEGTMTIVESRPSQSVRFRLDFVRPFSATNIASFEFVPDADGTTTVTWSMEGERNFIAKAIGLVIDCDKMVGGEFEKGLESLRSIVENKVRTTSAG